MINFTFCALKVESEVITFISFQQEMGVNSKSWNVTIYIMIYFTNRDLKLKDGEIDYLIISTAEEGSIFNVEIWPHS